MLVTVDLDTVVNGFPAIRFWPTQSNVGYTLPLAVNFAFLKNKEIKPY